MRPLASFYGSKLPTVRAAGIKAALSTALTRLSAS
jgi:hypothetical protein